MAGMQRWKQLQESFTLPAIFRGGKNVREEHRERSRSMMNEVTSLSGPECDLTWPRHPRRIYCSDFLTAGAPHTCTHNRNKSNIDCTASLNSLLHPYRADHTLSQGSERFPACKFIWRHSEASPRLTTDLTTSSILSSIKFSSCTAAQNRN